MALYTKQDKTLLSVMEKDLRPALVRSLRWANFGTVVMGICLSLILIGGVYLGIKIAELFGYSHYTGQENSYLVAFLPPLGGAIVVIGFGWKIFGRFNQLRLSARGRKELRETLQWINSLKPSSGRPQTGGYRDSPLTHADERFAFLTMKATDIVTITYDVVLTYSYGKNRYEQYSFVGVALFAQNSEQEQKLFNVINWAGKGDFKKALDQGPNILDSLGWREVSEQISTKLGLPIKNIEALYEVSSTSTFGFMPKIKHIIQIPKFGANQSSQDSFI